MLSIIVVQCRILAIVLLLGRGEFPVQGVFGKPHGPPFGGAAPAFAFCFNTASLVSSALISSRVFGSTSASIAG